MRPEGVEGGAEAGNVEDILYSNDVAIEMYFDGTDAGHSGMAIIGKGDILGRKRGVRCEGIVVGPHMIHRARVCDEDRCRKCRCDGGGKVG